MRVIIVNILISLLIMACGDDGGGGSGSPKPDDPADQGDAGDDKPGDEPGDKPNDNPDDEPNDDGTDFDPDADLVMLAFGDSITAGLNIDSFLSESEEKNWATGDKVSYSHLSRFQLDLEVSSIAVENVAVSGATTAGLEEQLQNVTTTRAHYATVLIGANDVCSWPANHASALESYKDRVTDLVDGLQQKFADISILLVSTPDLNQLYELKKDESSCRQIWAFAGGCQLLLGANASASDREAFHDRWEDMNEALSEVATASGENVKYTDKVAKSVLTVDDISTIDCFHPSETGQKRIAEESWDATFGAQVLE